MNLKTRTLNIDPRAINRTLFYTPFNPRVNLAIEDPLLLSSNPLIKQEGLIFARKYGTGSPLSEKTPELLQHKIDLEIAFSQKSFFESSVILSHQETAATTVEDAFLSSQIFLVPDNIKSPFSKSKTLYFSASNLFSIIDILNQYHLDALPILYLPKISLKNGHINFSDIKMLKDQVPLFLVIEDNFTFGTKGLNGFESRVNASLIDLLITHIPKNFGKMLTILSGEQNLLNTLLHHCFSNSSFFPPAAYLGMFSKILSLIQSMTPERNAIENFCRLILQTFGSKCTVANPLIIFHLNSQEEKEHFYKSLVDNGFLLPSAPFKWES